jgi:hypothetical protein
MKIPLSLATGLVALLAGCSSPGPAAHPEPAQVVDTAVAPSPAPSTAPSAPSMPAARAGGGCASRGEPPVPAPRAAADLPSAPRTVVAIVGTVCSAVTGEPIAGVRVGATTTQAFCAAGHQPWRCGHGTVTDDQGHYGLTLFDVDAYDLTVGLDGYREGGGTVGVTHPGVTKIDWTLVPLS